MKNCISLLSLLCICSCTTIVEPIRYSSEIVDIATPFAPGIISTTDQSEFDIMFSPDGYTAYFSRRAPGEKQKIRMTEFVNNSWTEPEVCSFSTDRDEAVSISSDGKMLFFGSERPIPGQINKGNFDMNIWMMRRLKNQWSEPEPLPAPINEVQDEGEEWPSSNNNFLSIVNDSTFLYSTMRKGSKAIKLYETTMQGDKFSEPKEIKGIFDDEKYWVYSPVVSPDGQFLVFNSFGAPGGAGGEDLFVSKKTDFGWSKAKAIGPKVNSTNEEGAPRFSRDGTYFFFTRAENLGNYEYGEWSIYYIETQYLELDKLFQ